MKEVHRSYMAELEIEVLRDKNKELKKEINQLKDLLDKHLNIKTIRMDKEQQKEYAIQIAEKVCNYYQINYGKMMSKYRGEEVTLARQMTMYLTLYHRYKYCLYLHTDPSIYLLVNLNYI